jgi:hypothetical protein
VLDPAFVPAGKGVVKSEVNLSGLLRYYYRQGLSMFM